MSQMQVKLIDSMGNDFSPIRAALVSNDITNYDKYIDEEGYYTDAAYSLINFLARGCTSGDWESLQEGLLNKTEKDLWKIDGIFNHVRHMPPHWTPFGHTAITVYVKAPIFVARQLGKHQVGFVWNEVSRRYVDKEPEFYLPTKWRGRSADKKQGSDSNVSISVAWYDRDDGYNSWPEDAQSIALEAYQKMLDLGVAPEQARMILPQNMMTEWYWTGNLYGFSKMFMARTDPHTQLETQEVAKMIGKVIKPRFPISWEALTT